MRSTRVKEKEENKFHLHNSWQEFFYVFIYVSLSPSLRCKDDPLPFVDRHTIDVINSSVSWSIKEKYYSKFSSLSKIKMRWGGMKLWCNMHEWVNLIFEMMQCDWKIKCSVIRKIEVVAICPHTSLSSLTRDISCNNISLRGLYSWHKAALSLSLSFLCSM